MTETVRDTSDDQMAAEASYRVARDYWRDARKASPEQFGVAPMGDCGAAEILYREHEEVRVLRRLVPLDRSKSILELGCGNGRWVQALAPVVQSYVAVDFSRAMLDFTAGRLRGLGIGNVELREAAMQDYQPDRSFDLIYLSGVSQYVHDKDLRDTLVRLRKFLRPGGRIVDRSTVHLKRKSVCNSADYFSIYRTSGDIGRLFEEAGLRLESRSDSYRALYLPRWMRNLLVRPKAVELVRALAPKSFSLLRAIASIFVARTGEALEFRHEFAVFRSMAEGADA